MFHFFRWAQATEELRQALLELEEEKEKRRCIEEDMSLRILEQDDLKSNFGAFFEKMEKAYAPPEEQHNLKETALSSDQEETKLLIVTVPEATEASESAKDNLDLSSVGQIQTVQVYHIRCICLIM